MSDFKLTEKQQLAARTIAQHTHTCLGGGSRSGKTFIILYILILRALKKTSRHLMARLAFNHIKMSVFLDTLPKVLRLCFPGMYFKLNKSDLYIEFPNGSQIFFVGTDEAERVERILGTEYSTIAFNEISQFKDYEIITTLLTRLAENSGLTHKVLYDLNPCSKKHWAHQLFIEKIIPGSAELLPNPEDYAYVPINPVDNLSNLPETYLKTLEALPRRQRERFMLGLWLTDIEGALWNEQMIINAQALDFGELTKTVIAVDPAVSNNPDSDETGIIVCGVDQQKRGAVLADLSGVYSAATWGQRVVNAYHEFGANAVVAEVNQGGDLVKELLVKIDPSVKVVTVRASKGKFVRAEPVQALYENNLVSHADHFPGLTEQMTEWVPLNSKSSPDRVDALVYGLQYLMIKPVGFSVRQL